MHLNVKKKACIKLRVLAKMGTCHALVIKYVKSRVSCKSYCCVLKLNFGYTNSDNVLFATVKRNYRLGTGT